MFFFLLYYSPLVYFYVRIGLCFSGQEVVAGFYMCSFAMNVLRVGGHFSLKELKVDEMVEIKL